MPRSLFVINRSAGRGLSTAMEKALRDYALAHEGAYKPLFATSGEEAITGVRVAINEGIDRIVAVGGDGTVNTVVNALFDQEGKPINEKVALAVIDSGGGCDYSSSLYGFHPPRIDDLLASGATRKVDVGRITFDNRAITPRYFVNMASAGLSAEVVRRRELSRLPVPAFMEYFIPTVATLFSYNASDLSLTLDGQPIDCRAVTVTLSKGAWAGGGMKFGLDVTLDDGQLEVTVIEERNRFYLARNLLKIYSGAYRGLDGVVKYRARQVTVQPANPWPVEIDGDLHGVTTLTAELLPGALRVTRPE